LNGLSLQFDTNTNEHVFDALQMKEIKLKNWEKRREILMKNQQLIDGKKIIRILGIRS
jgi:hypothetical protein